MLYYEAEKRPIIVYSSFELLVPFRNIARQDVKLLDPETPIEDLAGDLVGVVSAGKYLALNELWE